MNQSIIIYGPQGCGKTLNGRRLAKRFGLQNVVDDVLGNPWPAIAPNTLYLCQEAPPDAVAGQTTVYSFKQAMRLAGFDRPINASVVE